MNRHPISNIFTGASVRLRRPEYTGENRCIPCTAINLAIAAAATGGVALVSLPAAVAVGGGSLAAIYFRGYLVPGTPALTRRYLPERVLDWFGKTPGFEYDPTTLDVEALLTEAGAVEIVWDDVALTPGFETELRTAVGDIGADESMRAGLAEIVGVVPEDLNVEYFGDACRAYIGEELIAQWESRAAFLVDLAAHRTLASRYDAWDAMPVAARSQVVSGVRLSLEWCPVCDGVVSLEQTVVSSCCRDYDVVAATCEGCGARLFESRFDPAALEIPER